MNAYSTILEHLSYILESLLIGASGDAKSELDTLIDKIVNDPLYAVGDAGEFLPRLRQAVDEYRDGRERHGASLLCQVSRILWKRLLEQSEKANLGVVSNEPITTWEDVTEDQCFVFDDRLVADVWLELEKAVDPLMKNVQDDIKRGRSEPRCINGIFDDVSGLFVTRPFEILMAYEGNTHGGHYEYWVDKGGQRLSHLFALEVTHDPQGMIGAFYAALELPKKGCYWHGCRDRDYIFLWGPRALAVLREKSPDSESEVGAMVEDGRPFGIRLLKDDDGYRLSCLAVYPDGKIVDLSVAIDRGRIAKLPEEVVVPAKCLHFY